MTTVEPRQRSAVRYRENGETTTPSPADIVRGSLLSRLFPGCRSARPSLVLELLLLAGAYLVYLAIRVMVKSDAGAAFDNAADIYNLEQVLHLDPERALNSWLTDHPGFSRLAGYYYATLHFSATPLVLIWLYWRHPERYRWMRTALGAMTLSSLFVFWVYPVAPPRFAVSGLTDTLAQWHLLEMLAPRSSVPVANLYAAVPSLHVGWAAWCALAVWMVFRHSKPWLAWAVWIYPVITSLVVIATANHYLLDAPAGVLVLAFGALVATLIGRYGHRRRTVDVPVEVSVDLPVEPRDIPVAERVG